MLTGGHFGGVKHWCWCLCDFKVNFVCECGINMVKCSVYNCTSNSEKKVAGISFHRFPRGEERCSVWVANMNILNWTPTKNHRICSIHFEERYFYKSNEKTILLNEAVPTIFLEVPTNVQSRQKTKKRIQPLTPEPQPSTSAQIEVDTRIKTKRTLNKTAVPTLHPPVKLENKSKVGHSRKGRIGKKSNLEEYTTCNEEDTDVGAEIVDSRVNFIKVEPRNNKNNVNTSKRCSFEIKECSVKLIPLEYLESKCDSLLEENRKLKEQLAFNDGLLEENNLLKQLLVKIHDSRNSAAININGKEMGANNVIDLTDVQSVCRTCLQKSSEMVSLLDKVMIDNEHNMSILDALKYVISDSIEVMDNFPKKVCSLCRNHIQLFVIFKYAYLKATSILTHYANGVFGNLSLYKESGFESRNDAETFVKLEDTEMLDNGNNNTTKTLGCNESIQTELENVEHFDVGSEKSSVYEENVTIEPDDNSKMEIDQITNLYTMNGTKGQTSTVKSKQKIHTCPLCWKQLTISEFISHMKTHKDLKKYLTAPKIRKKFRYYASPRNIEGLLARKNGISHVCIVCESDFKANEVILHIDNHLRYENFTCEKCNKVFKKFRFLMSHMLVHNNNYPFRCPTCNKGFVVESNYKCHLLTHTNEELPVKCTECDKRFSNPQHLSRHMTVHRENQSYSSKYKYKSCKFCYQHFSNLEQLFAHVCHHSGSYICQYCKKKFRGIKARQIHIRTVHNKHVKPKPGYCRICNVTVKSMNYHNRTKHDSDRRKLLCSVCGLQVSDIYKHMEVHKSIRPHKCSICFKLFTNSSILRRHLLTHSGLKPYICSYCGKTFNRQSTLSVHERIHIGDRCHVCPICGKGFLEKSYLNKHMKVHEQLIVLKTDENCSE